MFKATAVSIFTILLLFPALLSGQNLLNEPESVVYDSLYNRYLVSNWGDGNIIEIDMDGNQAVFCTLTGSSLAGLHIDGEILFAAANDGVNPGLTGINLHTGEIIKVIYFAGQRTINGIVTDTSGYLYITEWENYMIFKVDFEAGTYTTFVDTDLGEPNGMYFDAPNNRILVTSWLSDGQPIKAVSLEDSTVSTVVATGIVSLDGLTRDPFGNCYFSSWATNSVHGYDSNFTGPPEVISSGHTSPADIFYDKFHHVIAVPNFNADRLDLINPHLSISSDQRWGIAPFEIQFDATSRLSADAWKWHFGDGDSAMTQSPSHTYEEPGIYDVTLDIAVGDETVSLTENEYIYIVADTLSASEVTGEPGEQIEVIITAKNTIPLNYIKIPVEYGGSMAITLDSFSTAGCRTDHFENKTETDSDPVYRRATYLLRNVSAAIPDLEPGFGPVLKLYFTIDPAAVAGQTAPITLDGYSSNLPRFKGMPNYLLIDYIPGTLSGTVSLPFLCGDADGGGTINLLDITYLINYLYKAGPEPESLIAADVNGSGSVNLLDITYLLGYLYKGGPAPACN